MASATQSIGSTCAQRTFPCWLTDIPKQGKPSDKVSGDWAIVELYKKKFKEAQPCELFNNYELEKHLYCMERSTGDLYVYGTGQTGKGCYSDKIVPWNETKGRISAKCFAIFLATIPYIITMMAINLVRIVYDIYRIAKTVFSDFKNSLKNDKGFLTSIHNGIMTLAWKIPSEVMDDIWRVVRCPFFAVGMLFASAYGVFVPLEGRRWFSEIEDKLHEGAPALQHPFLFKSDWSIRKKIDHLGSKISWDQPLYLGWCMHKRGNIHQKIHGQNRFEYVSTYIPLLY